MEGVGLMALDKRIIEELMKVNKVSEARCEKYNLIYNEKILPSIQEKFLAHLVSVTEDLILEKLKEKDPNIRRYRITIWKNNPNNGKASIRLWRYGAIIPYNPKNDYRDLRVFVAHELGHLLCWYQILEGDATDNNANLFAYFAINGKNMFYRDKAPTLVYRGGELEIISSIQVACPIIKEDQI
jgi:hypothetical protein